MVVLGEGRANLGLGDTVTGEEDCVLLAGHLRLVQSLLSCDGVSKAKVGTALIHTLLDIYLFPASKV